MGNSPYQTGFKDGIIEYGINQQSVKPSTGAELFTLFGLRLRGRDLYLCFTLSNKVNITHVTFPATCSILTDWYGLESVRACSTTPSGSSCLTHTFHFSWISCSVHYPFNRKMIRVPSIQDCIFTCVCLDVYLWILIRLSIQKCYCRRYVYICVSFCYCFLIESNIHVSINIFLLISMSIFMSIRLPLFLTVRMSTDRRYVHVSKKIYIYACLHVYSKSDVYCILTICLYVLQVNLRCATVLACLISKSVPILTRESSDIRN